MLIRRLYTTDNHDIKGIEGENMKLLKTSITAILSLSLLASAAYGDLDSSTYAGAREEYARGNCYEALSLLKKFKGEDEEFLDKNPRVLSAINDGINYCEAILFPYLPGTSYPTGPPQKPDLPPNMAHAFDSEARLRMLIAELNSGKPRYDHMEPMLRIVMRRHAAQLAQRLQTLGPLVSLSYEGPQDDADVYEAGFKNGTAACMIGIAPNGNVAVFELE